MLRFFVTTSAIAFALACAPSTVAVEATAAPASATVSPEDCAGPYADPGDGFHVVQVEPDIMADPDQNVVVEAACALDHAIARARNRSDATEPGLRTFATKDVVTDVVNIVEWQLSLCRGVIGSSLTYIHNVRLDGDAATVSQCFVSIAPPSLSGPDTSAVLLRPKRRSPPSTAKPRKPTMACAKALKAKVCHS